MDIYTSFLFLVLGFNFVLSAPISAKTSDKQTRQQKSLGYYDYIQPEFVEYNNYVDGGDDYASLDLEEQDLSRTIPSRKRLQQNRPYNSPIYYIRMPPQPYMFIPGLGYVSQPPSPHLNPMQQFLNVPVSFVANGKPSTIFQWGSGLGQFPETVTSRPVPTPKPTSPPKKATESPVHKLPGKYTFNGKPEDIYLLRDSYNSLYSDALQNFYP